MDLPRIELGSQAHQKTKGDHMELTNTKALEAHIPKDKFNLFRAYLGIFILTFIFAIKIYRGIPI